MKTVLLIVALIFASVVAWKVSLFALNIAGLPGALIAGSPNKRAQSVAYALRFLAGVMVATLCQSYVYLAYVAFIVIFTRHRVHDADAFGPVLWPMAFIASFAPIYLCTGAAIGDALGREENAQEIAVWFTEILAVVSFFIFAFFPNVIALGWPWISYISH